MPIDPDQRPALSRWDVMSPYAPDDGRGPVDAWLALVDAGLIGANPPPDAALAVRRAANEALVLRRRARIW